MRFSTSLVLGLVLFDIFIKDLKDTTQACLVYLWKTSSCEGVAATLEDRIRIPEITLEKWSKINQIKFRKDKCKVLHFTPFGLEQSITHIQIGG